MSSFDEAFEKMNKRDKLDKIADRCMIGMIFFAVIIALPLLVVFVPFYILGTVLEKWLMK